MNLHASARSCPASRALLCHRVEDEGWDVTEAAEAAGLSRRRAQTWLSRSRRGDRALRDGSSRPKRVPLQTQFDREEVIRLLRLSRWSGPKIARGLKMPRSTVAAVLKRLGLSRLPKPAAEQAVEIQRYEKHRPGELVHLDIKKLGRIVWVGHRIHGDRRIRARGAGWEFVHLAIDDATRLAYAEVLEDEKGETTAAFLVRAQAHFAFFGIPKFERILTDNGSPYVSKAFAAQCQALTIKHSRTRPYRPQTNGKAERMIQTLIREWAYVRPYLSSLDRTRALQPYLRYYNEQRPHGALEDAPPFQRLTTYFQVNNVPGNHS